MGLGAFGATGGGGRGAAQRAAQRSHLGAHFRGRGRAWQGHAGPIAIRARDRWMKWKTHWSSRCLGRL